MTPVYQFATTRREIPRRLFSAPLQKASIGMTMFYVRRMEKMEKRPQRFYFLMARPFFHFFNPCHPAFVNSKDENGFAGRRIRLKTESSPGA